MPSPAGPDERVERHASRPGGWFTNCEDADMANKSGAQGGGKGPGKDRNGMPGGGGKGQSTGGSTPATTKKDKGGYGSSGSKSSGGTGSSQGSGGGSGGQHG